MPELPRQHYVVLVGVLALWASLIAYTSLGLDPSRWDSFDRYAPPPYADVGTTFFRHPDSEQHLISLWCP